jgi:hypothetical protein
MTTPEMSSTKLLETNDSLDSSACDASEIVERKPLVESEAFEPYEVNNAKILGDIPDHVLNLKFSLGYGKNRQDKRWPPKAMTYKDFIVGLSNHNVGEKDGKAFIQGTAIGNERKVPAIDALYIMGLDVDSGIWPQQVIDKLTKLGLSAVIYTTHSHMKTDTFLVESSFNQWCKRERIDADVTEENVRRYLIEARYWEKWVADSVEVGEVAQTSEGKGYWLTHDAMPKFRIVFPLNEPFVIAKQAMSQLDAINLWKSKLIGLSKVLELPIDQSCLDPSRLFYLPRHSQGAQFGVWVTGGVALDFSGIPEGKARGRDQNHATDVFARAADDLAAKDGKSLVVKGVSLKRWARECADDFDIVRLFNEVAKNKVRAEQSESKMTVECPFDYTHSNAGDTNDAGCFVQSPAPEVGFASFSFQCSHNACKARDRLEMIAEAVNQDWFSVDDLRSTDYRLGLVDGTKKPTESIEGGVTFYKREDAIVALNEVAAVVQIGSNTSYLVCQEKGEELNFKTKQAASDWFANWRCVYEDEKGKAKEVPAFDVWMKSTERRQYNKVVFRPEGTPKNPRVYNTWTGLAVEPKEGGWRRLQRHLFEVWCDCDPDLFEWTLAWFAQLFQQPEVKLGTAMVVYSPRKGTGKSIVARPLRRILDIHASTLSASDALTAKFNGFMERSLLVIGEEIIWGGKRDAIGPLKAAITESTVMLEKKYQDPVELDNFSRFLLFSNEERAIPAEGDDERRFFVLRAGEQHIQDTDYFGALAAEIDNGGTEAMLFDLMGFDFNRVDLRNPPKTAGLAEQTEANLSADMRWWYSVLMDGCFADEFGNPCDDTTNWESREVLVSRKTVFDSFNAAVKTYGMNSATSATIGRFLSRVVPTLKTRQHKGGQRDYVFPALPECRKAFEQASGVRFACQDEEAATVAGMVNDPFYQAGHELEIDADIAMIVAGGLGMEAARWYRSETRA